MKIESVKLNEFELVNPEKWNRAVFGSIGSGGALVGGVGEGATDEVKLTQYDKLGGLIKKDGRTVKTGCFWDFAKKKAVEKPVVIFQFQDLDGNKVFIEDGKEIPMEVIAAEHMSKKKTMKAVKEEVEKKDE